MSGNTGPVEDVPYVMKKQDKTKKGLTPTTKSYRNQEFLNGHEGRTIRILCEFEEPAMRLKRNFVRTTVLVFGSARSMSTQQYKETCAGLEAEIANGETEEAKATARDSLARLQKTEWMCEWVDVVEQVSRLITQFATNEKRLIQETFSRLPDYFRLNLAYPDEYTGDEVVSKAADLVITTGGGPGFMEAANRGASSVPGAKTMGMGISLPFEKGLNPYVSKDLSFEFHYFFTRKFWMMYTCRAIVVAPGGFGTLDELFELLTLRQTRKITDLPVVLLGSKFWKTVVNWQALADFGTVSQKEVDSLCFADTAEEAVDFIRKYFQEAADKAKNAMVTDSSTV